MNTKKWLSFILSLALVVTSFAGMTVTASALDGPMMHEFMRGVTFSKESAAGTPVSPLFTPGSGATVTLPAANAASYIPGLYVKENDYDYYPVVNNVIRYAWQINFYSPAIEGSGTWTLEVTTDGGISWNACDSGKTYPATGERSSIWTDPDDGINQATYRLKLVMADSQTYYTNTVDVERPNPITEFTAWSAAGYTDQQTAMAPYVGCGCEISSVAVGTTSALTLSEGDVIYEWYRVNPSDFSMSLVSSSATQTVYNTTVADIGYQILCKIKGDDTDVGGYLQVFPIGEAVSAPVRAYVSNATESSFYLNLENDVTLGNGDLKVETYEGTPCAISAVQAVTGSSVYLVTMDASPGGYADYDSSQQFMISSVKDGILIGEKMNQQDPSGGDDPVVNPPATPSAGGGGGGGGGTAAQPAPATSSTTTGKVTTAKATLEGSVSGTTATASVSKETVTSLLDSAKKAETNGQKASVEFAVNSPASATEVKVAIPKNSFNQIAGETKADVSVKASLATLTFDEKAVQTVNDAGTGDISISIEKKDNTQLPEETKQIVGDRPVFDFTVKAGSTEVSSFNGGSVSVSIPYTLQTGEDPSAVVVYYIDNNGDPNAIRGSYNSSTGTVDFVTTHFSQYAVGYHKVTFSDVKETAWYNDAVTFIAARGITTGTSEGVFSPSAKLTRAQFLVMALRAYGIEADENPAVNFSDAGNTYYTGYLAAAKRLGISNGDGNGLYLPNEQITRQDMFVLLYRTLEVLGEIPEAQSSAGLDQFSDEAKVSAYAKTPMEALIKANVVSGSSGMLDPKGVSNRAQMAQVLYNLLSE